MATQRFDALLLPGGHAKGMRVYLESEVLQRYVADWFDGSIDGSIDDGSDGEHRPVAAVCHGVLLAARSISQRSGKSVLYGRKVTSLPWSFEKPVWKLTRVTRYWDPNYYRTYLENPGEPEGYWSVELEVKRHLQRLEDFINVPRDDPHYWRRGLGLVRDRLNDERAAWVVRDGALITARWPGDVHTFARQFVEMLRERYGGRNP